MFSMLKSQLDEAKDMVHSALDDMTHGRVDQLTSAFNFKADESKWKNSYRKWEGKLQVTEHFTLLLIFLSNS